jgi:soluble lytic murein transglycosylase-like protein
MSRWLFALALLVFGDYPDTHAAYAAGLAKDDQTHAASVAASEAASAPEPPLQTSLENVARCDMPPRQAEPSDPALAPLISEASSRFDLSEPWIRAVMQVESNGEADATSSKGAMGLMQVMPATYAYLSDRYGLSDDPYAPRDNILAGSAYLRELYDRYGAAGFLAAYNAGPGRYEDSFCRGCSLPTETKRYVAAVRLAVGEVLFEQPHSRFYQPIAIAPNGALTLARTGEPMPADERLALHSVIQRAVQRAAGQK